MPGLLGISCMSWSLVSSSLLTLWTGPFWIALWVDFACLTGFVGLFFLIIVRFVSGLSLLLVLESLGAGTVVYTRVVRLVWCSLLPCVSRGVVILSAVLRPGALF